MHAYLLFISTTDPAHCATSSSPQPRSWPISWLSNPLYQLTTHHSLWVRGCVHVCVGPTPLTNVPPSIFLFFFFFIFVSLCPASPRTALSPFAVSTSAGANCAISHNNANRSAKSKQCGKTEHHGMAWNRIEWNTRKPIYRHARYLFFMNSGVHWVVERGCAKETKLVQRKSD